MPCSLLASSNTERAVLSSGLQPGRGGAPPAAVSCPRPRGAPSSAAEDAAGLEDDLGCCRVLAPEQWEALCSVRAGAEDALGEVTRGSCSRAGRLGRVPEQTSCVRPVCAQCQLPAVLVGTSCLAVHSKCPLGPCLCSWFSCWDPAG